MKIKKACIFLICVIMISVLLFSCDMKPNESDTTDSSAVEETSEIIKNNEPFDIGRYEEFLHVGQTYSEIVEIIGKEGTDIGSGVILFRWEFENGQELRIHFNQKSNNGDLISNSIQYVIGESES